MRHDQKQKSITDLWLTATLDPVRPITAADVLEYMRVKLAEKIMKREMLNLEITALEMAIQHAENDKQETVK